jgi:Ca-activated chloride channel family protein
MGDGLVRALELQTAGNTATPTPSPAASGAPSAQPAEVIPLAVVLLSDGANTAGTHQPLDAATQAKQLNVPVYTIALGTPGGTITVAGGRGGVQTVAVPPDPDTLKQIAEITGAGFYTAPTESDLHAIYQDLGSRVGFTQEDQEVTVLFAGLGLVFMLIGGAFAAMWFNRIP